MVEAVLEFIFNRFFFFGVVGGIRIDSRLPSVFGSVPEKAGIFDWRDKCC